MTRPEDAPIDMSDYHRDRWDGDMDPTDAELWTLLGLCLAGFLAAAGLIYWVVTL